MRTQVSTGAFWFALVCAAAALSVLAANHDTLTADRAITDWLQDRPLPGQDLSDTVRTITGTEVVLATGAALCLLLWFRGYRRQAILLVAGLALLPLLQFALKEIVDRPRPDPALIDIRAGFSSKSFPAGHVMSGTYLYAFVAYLVLVLPMRRWAAASVFGFCVALLALAGPVNVWLGVHWPSDVLGGWLWSAVLLFPLVVVDWRNLSFR
jgi:undecaprenyl-diphosphatase